MPINTIFRTLLAGGVAGLAMLSVGCPPTFVVREHCQGDVTVVAGANQSPISKAIYFLATTQIAHDEFRLDGFDYAGGWPQCFTADPDGAVLVRDVSPFIAAFVHHALSQVTEASQDRLELTRDEIDTARRTRMKAVAFMRRFEGRASETGTFGFWPLRTLQWRPGDLLIEALMVANINGPRFAGTRSPLNFSAFPRIFSVYPDADVTAATYAVLLDNTRLESGPEPAIDIGAVFSTWRDDGSVTQRNQQPWLPPASGAFLTWLANGPGGTASPNDVDPPVVANVLYVLGRYGALETPGVADSVALLNAITSASVHLRNPDALSLYYPDNFAFHYFVVRAHIEGQVENLAPAAEALLADVRASAQPRPGGELYWDRGTPIINTCFAMLSLLAMEGASPETAAAARYLRVAQDPYTGGFPEEVFFFGQLDADTRAEWVSQAFTTALALEALAQQALHASSIP